MSTGGRMAPREPEYDGPVREPTPEGHRNGRCPTCGAEIGENCRCRKNGRYMSGVHEGRKRRTERTGAALLSRAELKSKLPGVFKRK